MPGTCSPCHAQECRLDICIRGTNDSDFFSLLASNCSQQKGPTNKVWKMLPVSSPENWLNESKAGRAKPGKQSRGTPQCGCGAWGWARVGAEEGHSHPPLMENNPGSNFWPSACAEARGGGAMDQGSPAASCGFSLAAALIYF